jgi:putative transcriptional regulator
MKAPQDDDRQSIAPTLLVSMPQLNDPNFARTVVLLCEHGPEGAFGLVLNRPTDTDAADAVQLTPPPAHNTGVHLWFGGPVEPQRGWILLAREPAEAEAVEVVDGLFLTTSPDVLRRLIEQGEIRSRVLTGYAGWAPGQLDEELAASAWLTANVDLDLVFDVPASEMWEAAIRRLGADPALLQMGHGVH